MADHDDSLPTDAGRRDARHAHADDGTDTAGLASARGIDGQQRPRWLGRLERVGPRLAAVGACVVFVIGALLVVTWGDDPGTAVDAVGPPAVVDEPLELALEAVTTTGLDGSLRNLVALDDGLYGVAVDSADLRDPTAPARIVLSDDGVEWHPVEVTIQSGDVVRDIEGRGTTLGLSGKGAGGGGVVYLRTEDGWSRHPVEGESPSIAILPDGSLHARTFARSETELRREAADELLDAAVREHFGPGARTRTLAPGNRPDGSRSDDPLDAYVEVERADGSRRRASLSELGLDTTTAGDLLARMLPDDGAPPIADFGSEKLWQVTHEGLVPVAVPDLSPMESPAVMATGEVMVANTARGEAQWLRTDGWEPVPAALTAGELLDVRSSTLGAYALIWAEDARLYRAETLDGPWVEVDLAPEGRDDAPSVMSVGSLAVDDRHVIALVTRLHGFPVPTQEDAATIGPPGMNGEEPLAVLDVDGYRVEVWTNPQVVKVFDRSGDALDEFDTEELDSGSAQVDAGENQVVLHLSDGTELTVPHDQWSEAVTATLEAHQETFDPAALEDRLADDQPREPIEPETVLYVSADGISFRQARAEGFNAAVVGPEPITLTITQSSGGLRTQLSWLRW